MSQHTPHGLLEEFPEFKDSIRIKKQSDAHFAKLADDYHRINRLVHRHESEIEALSDEHITEIKKERLALKDTLHSLLTV
ncbi:YdcH family protein [Kiloniella sp.]|uniref:YdcH family protein n=1 Tax=Kiloniella sp. TaxID=1938587 RepID=UPI003B016884